MQIQRTTSAKNSTPAPIIRAPGMRRTIALIMSTTASIITAARNSGST
jgi:hypothetical protein